MDEIEQIIQKGSYVAFDTILAGYMSGNLEPRIERIVELCARGHADRLLLSQDDGCFKDLRPRSAQPERESFPTFAHLVLDFLPTLRDRGVSDDQIEQMMFRNPRQVFESRALGPY